MILDPAKTHRIGLRTGTRRSHWAARFQFSPCGHRSRILPPGGLRPERHPNRAAPPRVGVFLPNGQAIAVVLGRKLFGIEDLQRIDIGIAICHFELTMKGLGLQGRWAVQPIHENLPDAHTEYVVSYEG